MRLILIAFISFAFTSCWAQDEGLILNWEKYIDSQDLVITYDSVVVDTGIVYIPDTSFRTKFRSIDTSNYGRGQMGGYAYNVQVNEVDSASFVNFYLSKMIESSDQIANLMIESMKQRGNSLSYKQAFEELTGIVNARTEVYNQFWPRLDSMTIRTTITGGSFAIQNAKYKPNSAGVVIDSEGKRLMRIFPFSAKMWLVIVANDGDLQTGIFDYLYSQDGRVYLNYEANSEFGRLVIRNDKVLR